MKIGSLFWDIGAKTDAFDKGLEESKNKAKSFGEQSKLAFTELNSAIALAGRVLDGFKQGYEFAREGAEIEFTTEKFERLAKTIGTTSDMLMGDLRDATRGMMSDAELMASATDLMSLGLVKTHDEAVRLTTVAGQLGMDMNQLVLTLTNQTTMRFDALGVSVDGFDAKVKALEATGLSAQEAFGQAFLQQAEEQVQKVGEAADGSTAAFIRFETVIANLTDETKKLAAEALTPAVKALTLLLEWDEKVTNMKKYHSAAVAEASTSYADYVVSLFNAKEAAYGLTKAEERARDLIIETGKATFKADEIQRGQSATIATVISKMEGMTAGAYDAAVALVQLTKDTKYYNYVVENGITGAEEITENIMATEAAEMKAAAASRHHAVVMKNATSAGDDYADFYAHMTDNTRDAINANRDMQKAEARLTEQMLRDLEERNAAMTAYNEFKIGEVERFSNIEKSYAEDSAAVAEELAEVQAELALKRSQGYAEWGGTIQGLLDKETELVAKQKEIEDAHDRATKSIVLGYIEQKLAADGILTDEETTWLLEKGVEWGIYAENAVQAYQDAMAAADEAMGHFQDKTVTLTVNTVIAGGGNVGLGANAMPSGYTDYYPNPQASGGDYFVTAPTVFTAGEAGPERATFTPVNQMNQQQQPAAEIDYRKMGEAITEALLQTGAIG